MAISNSAGVAPAGGITAQQSGNSEIKKVVAASMAGTVAEWYEFFIYGVASTLVFGPLFFPGRQPLSAIIAAFATYAVGFIARPLGGIVFGHFGDRLGRKKLLQFSLLLVGSSTFLMGCLPGFQAIGFAAPALLVLLRFIQGFAVGGSGRGGAADRRTLAARPARLLGQLSAIGGLHRQCAGLDRAVRPVLAAVQGGLPGLGLARGLLAVRDHRFRRLLHSPFGGGRADFRGILSPAERARKKAASLKDALAAYPGKTFFSILLRVGENTVYYVIVVFSITYLTVHAKLPSQTVMFIMFIANIFQFFSMLFGGYLSDRIGRKACIALGYAGLLVWAFLYFPGLDSGSNVHILGVICMGLFFQALCYGPQAAYFSEIFPTSMRYAGASFCYQIATIVAGSIAPLVATLLLRDYGGTGPIVTYLAGTVVLSLLALAVLSETRNVSLHEVDRAHQDRHGA